MNLVVSTGFSVQVAAIVIIAPSPALGLAVALILAAVEPLRVPQIFKDLTWRRTSFYGGNPKMGDPQIFKKPGIPKSPKVT